MYKKSIILFIIAGEKGSVAYLVKMLSTNLNVDFISRVYNIKNKKSIFSLYHAIRSSDVVHLHSAIPIGIAWLVRLINRNVVIVGTFHDLGKPYFKYTLPLFKRIILSKLFDLGIKHLNHMIFVSYSQMAFYLQNGYLLNKPVVIPNSFEVLFELGEKNSNKSMNLAFIGGPFFAKGYDFIVTILDSLEDYNLHFYGLTLQQVPKKFQPICESNIKKNKMYFYGLMDQKLMYANIISLNSIVIISSYGEGLPLTALECVSLKIPLIVNDLEVFKEFLPCHIIPRFNTGNLNTLINALNEVKNISYSLQKELAIKINEQFKMKTYIDSHNNFYKSIIHRYN